MPGGHHREETRSRTWGCGTDGQRGRHRRSRQADQEERERRHLRSAAGSKVVRSWERGPAGTRRGLQEGESLVRDHERRRRRPEAEDAGRPVPLERRQGGHLVSLDAGSSIAIEKAAAAKNAKVIEYDRQVKGGTSSIYISFDGAKVGVLQGQGVVAGLKKNGMYGKKPVVAELNGGQTDNNSYLFKGGYDSILKPLYKNGTFVKGPDQFNPTGTTRRQARSSSRCSSRRTTRSMPSGGQRRPRERGCGRAQGSRPEADPALRPGCDGTGCPEHHFRFADDDRLEDTRVLATKSALAPSRSPRARRRSRTRR